MQQVVQHLGQLLERRRLDAAEGGDTQHNIVALVLIELAENIGRLVTLEVNQNSGDDLRVLLADQIEDVLRLHKVERFDTVRPLLGIQQVFKQAGGPLLAQRLDQYAAQIVVGVDAQYRVLAGVALEFAKNSGQIFMGKSAHIHHRTTDLFDLMRIEMFEHFGGQSVAEGQHDDGTFIVGIHCCFMSLLIH